MKLLYTYLKPYKWLVFLALGLAAINQTFSLFDPMIFGWLIDDFANHPKYFDAAKTLPRTEPQFIQGLMKYLLF